VIYQRVPTRAHRPTALIAKRTAAGPRPVSERKPRVNTVLEVSQLERRYGDVVAVADVSFSVREGESFGILGPNGAGKTTTLEIIEGLRRPDAGRVTLLGHDMLRHPRPAQARIGVQLQAAALFDDLTVRETIELFAALYPRSGDPGQLMDRLALGEKESARVKNLSGGQRQRLSVTIALVNDPDVVFLDEPTTGLDPQARRELWDLVREMQRDRKTIILTTHYMEEAEQLCGRVAIMDRGHIVALDTPRALIRRLDFENTIEFNLEGVTDPALFRALPSVRDVRVVNGNFILSCGDISSAVGGVMETASRVGAPVREMQVRTATLEDVFIAFTGRRLRD
jgi:ABC-2 type transport system ATP-binding protein